MSKSLILTSNYSPQILDVGNIIELGNVVRRFGQNLRLDANTINARGAGYYKVDANIELTGTSAGVTKVTMLKDGVPYAERSISLDVAGVGVVPIDTVFRVYNNCDSSNISFRLDGTAQTVTGISVVVTKE